MTITVKENGLVELTPSNNMCLRDTFNDILFEKNQPAYLLSENESENYVEVEPETNKPENIICKDGLYIIPNENGDPFTVNGTQLFYNTSSYTGGIIFQTYFAEQHKAIEVTYKTDKNVDLTLQINGSIKVIETLQACEEYITETFTLPENTSVHLLELYIDTNGTMLSGVIDIKEIVFVD